MSRRNLRGSQHPNWKGDAITVESGRVRALHLYPDTKPCETCGDPKAERHHRDGNTANNAPENIQFLCRRHHMESDGRLARLRLRMVTNRERSGRPPRFTQDDIDEARRLYAAGSTQAQIGQKLGTTQGHVSRLLRGAR